MVGHITASLKDLGDVEYAIASFCVSLDPAHQSEGLTGALLERALPLLRQMVEDGKVEGRFYGMPAALEFEIIKGHGLEFVLIARGADRNAYQTLATVLAKQLEPILHSVSPPAKLCLGLSLYPGAGDSGEDLLARSRIAMYFAEEHGTPPVSILKAEAVPTDFRPTRRITAMKGELGVLDSAELLQSIASGIRSGVLVVDDGFGKEFTMTVSAGKPVDASLGKLSGQDAIAELIVTFDAGSFNFKEMEIDDVSRAKKLPALANMLMEGALAQDYYLSARQVLRRTDQLLVKGANIEHWTELVDKTDVSEREYLLMQSLLALLDSDSTLTLEKMLVRMDHCPTHLRWRSAALLHSYGAIAFA